MDNPKKKMKVFCLAILSLLLIGTYIKEIFLYNDATTSLKHPPEFVVLAQKPANQGRDMSFQGGVFVEPLVLPISEGELFSLALEVAKNTRGFSIVSIDEKNQSIELIAKTALAGFKDDVKIEVRPSETGSSSLHMRSKSRVGKGDLGANKKRIKHFFSLVQARHLLPPNAQ